MIKTSFPPIADADCKVLLLGTIPGEVSLKNRQYYAHKGNQFWKIIFALFNEPITDNYEFKKNLLLSKGIALWDVLQHCNREGSADSKIKNEISNDFAGFYQRHPAIRHIFFTSGKAQDCYDAHVGRQPKMSYYKLPSPSSANTWKTFDDKINEWQIILNHL